MKIAIIADIHGNYYALEAVLAQIEKENVDKIVCAGDMINPFYESQLVWDRLKDEKVTCLRGNHEDYLIDFYAGKEYLKAYNLKPIAKVAESLSAETAKEIAVLPLNHCIKTRDDVNLFICHASPLNNKKSFMNEFDQEMINELMKVDAAAVVNAHLHLPESRKWENRDLISAGSVGLPMCGKKEAEYLIMTYVDKRWIYEHQSVKYDHQAAINSILASNFLEEAGSLSWLLFDELLTADKNFARFIPKLKRENKTPVLEKEWTDEVISFLKNKNRWDVIKKYV